MKCISRLLLLCIAAHLLISVTSHESKSSHHSHMKNLLHRRHSMRQDEEDCGCKIVYAYYEPPKEVKKRPYKARWPKKEEPKKEEPKTIVPTCEPGDGGAFLAELRKLFPPSISVRKPKPQVETKGESGSVTVTVSHSSSTVVASGPPKGQFTKQIYDMCVRFHSKVIKAQKGGVPTKSKKGKKPLSPEERRKEEMKATRRVFVKQFREKCYSKLRNYLEPTYKIPFKGSKCHEIGRTIFTCLNPGETKPKL